MNTRDQIALRPMREADAATVAELATQLGYPSEAETISARLRLIPDSNLLLVALIGDSIPIGFVHAHPTCIIEIGFRIEIAALVVAADVRRRGVARALLAAVESWARELGAPAIVVRSNLVRIESHHLYPAAGYELVKRQAVYEKRLA